MASNTVWTLKEYAEDGGRNIHFATTEKWMAKVINNYCGDSAYLYQVVEEDVTELDAYGCGEIIQIINAEEWMQEYKIRS